MGLTPMMQQYLQVKEKSKDCILFFRLGDFYEMFFEDAELASKELELVLTGRDCGLENRAPMCGIPFHAANGYIGRLVSKGYKVAICEQLEDPSAAKGIVRRDIIKIITPGTYTDSLFLEDTKNNYIMSIFINSEDNEVGLCFSDISTGEFNCTDCGLDIPVILNEISKFNPKEIIIHNNFSVELKEAVSQRFNISMTMKEENFFIKDIDSNLKNQFEGFDFSNFNGTVLKAINGLMAYIYETQKIALSNINSIDYYNIVDFLSLDINTRMNLELTETLREKGKKGSLLWVIDKTSTSMGARQLRKWVEQPLINKKSIENRLDAIEELINNIPLHEDIKEALKEVYDIERIAGKISSKSVNAKELLSLKNSISKIPKIKAILTKFNSTLLKEMFNNLDELTDIYEILEKAIIDNPAISVKDGNIIKTGYNSLVDELRTAKANGKEWIAALENSEREATGIRSLKVSYNKVFGYYIEITKANFDSVPQGRYIRKQTLANAERYITPELKEMEEKILGAEEKLTNLEYELFVEIRETIETHIDRLKSSAKLISEVDCLNSLAQVAMENNYCKPNILTDGKIHIEEGRHPVVEKMIPTGTFVSNSTYLDNTDEQLLLITGPNMAGKSTYMRQVALIVILAQIGSFVPANKADICICDKVFTRIGASDDLAAGKSTFMVEMWEVSNILKNATKKSLILLDEVGRGTSTYDGLSIAWAVIEHICNEIKLRSKTLFATHYHELTKLENVIPGVKNYSVAVKEVGSEVVFLRKIVPGGADQSYGIEVAKLAGIPEKVITRAKEILENLETDNKKDISPSQIKVENITTASSMAKDNQEGAADNNIGLDNNHNVLQEADEAAVTKEEIKQPEILLKNNIKQLDFSDIERANLVKEIANLDIMNMTPMESFNKMYELIRKAKGL